MKRGTGIFVWVSFLRACGLSQAQSVSAPLPPATALTATSPPEAFPTTRSPPESPTGTHPLEASPTPSNAPATSDKWLLWTNGTQRRGANYVNISHAGLFIVEPPYRVDEATQANLNRISVDSDSSGVAKPYVAGLLQDQAGL